MPEDRFDESIAAAYEAKWPEIFEPAVVDATVGFLADRAGDGAALELGVGTGRVARPLHRRGIPVHGIDLSPAMVAELRRQPGGDSIDVTVGDFASTEVDGRFTLAYLVSNTIMNLTTQDEQVACFRNAAAHLEPGGRFVVEVVVPAIRRLPLGETVLPFTVMPAHLGFDEYVDFVAQISWSHHYWIDGERLETFSAPFRYVWPSELDLMARLAGMVRCERWADWDRTPFTGTSASHVSVWQKTTG